MNKLLIGLLIVAAGAGVFFLLRKKKNTTTTNEIKKEWIVGKWKADAGKDSAFSNYHYDFLKMGSFCGLSTILPKPTLHIMNGTRTMH